jgi:hypothetical protein
MIGPQSARCLTLKRLADNRVGPVSKTGTGPKQGLCAQKYRGSRHHQTLSERRPFSELRDAAEMWSSPLANCMVGCGSVHPSRNALTVWQQIRAARWRKEAGPVRLSK